MVDRQRARFFDLRLDDLRERGAIVHMLSRSGSSYGFNGYEGGHAERRVAEEALQHFKAVSERLRTDFEKGIWERVIVGCQDANWPEFEANLHPYVKQRVMGDSQRMLPVFRMKRFANTRVPSWIVGYWNGAARKPAKRSILRNPTDAVSLACGAFCRRSKPGSKVLSAKIIRLARSSALTAAISTPT